MLGWYDGEMHILMMIGGIDVLRGVQWWACMGIFGLMWVIVGVCGFM